MSIPSLNAFLSNPNRADTGELEYLYSTEFRDAVLKAIHDSKGILDSQSLQISFQKFFSGENIADDGRVNLFKLLDIGRFRDQIENAVCESEFFMSFLGIAESGRVRVSEYIPTEAEYKKTLKKNFMNMIFSAFQRELFFNYVEYQKGLSGNEISSILGIEFIKEGKDFTLVKIPGISLDVLGLNIKGYYLINNITSKIERGSKLHSVNFNGDLTVLSFLVYGKESQKILSDVYGTIDYCLETGDYISHK